MNQNDQGRDDQFSGLKDGLADTSIETFYDDWAQRYDETLKDWNYQAPDDAAALLLPHLPADARVLDVGCGTGLMADALARHTKARLDGLDLSARSLDLAKARGTYARLIHHDLQILPLPAEDDAYDAATCIGVLTYIDDAEALLADMCRCVRAGGVIAFTQRTDLWDERAFAATIDRLARKGLWTTLTISQPRPYLPGNDDFAAAIEVVHTLCRVD